MIRRGGKTDSSFEMFIAHFRSAGTKKEDEDERDEEGGGGRVRDEKARKR
jgi:hypothetical protein